MFHCSLCSARFHDHYKSRQDGKYCVFCYITMLINSKSRM